jgi:hypothetical protein
VVAVSYLKPNMLTIYLIAVRALSTGAKRPFGI